MKFIVLILFLNSFLFSQENNDTLKVGLALSGGSALGFAHIGALEVIDSLGIEIDYIAGTSMGAVVGALYSIGYSPKQLKDFAINTDWESLFSDTPNRNKLPFFEKEKTGKYQIELELDGLTPVIPSGLVNGQKIMITLSRIIGNYNIIKDFNNLPIPFSCVAADLISGKEFVINNGSLAKAIRSSISIPSVFKPVEFQNKLLIDGGVINNFPVDVVKDMGANFVIGLNLTYPPISKNQFNNLLKVLDRTTEIPRNPRLLNNISLADLYIEEPTEGYSLTDFDKNKIIEIINIGKEAAYSQIDKLLQLKKRLNTKKEQESNLLNNKVFKISGIKIIGNQSFSDDFFLDRIRLQPDEILNFKVLEEDIEDLYSLNFFSTIHYEIDNTYINEIDLKIIVAEKTLRNLYIGFRYDDAYQLVGKIGVDLTSFILSGLRTEFEIQFAGLSKFHLRNSHPLKSLNISLYPYIEIRGKNLPIKIFDFKGNPIAEYRDKSFTGAIGVGLTFFDKINFEGEYNAEFMDIETSVALNEIPNSFPEWKERIVKLELNTSLDLLDDAIFPKRGIRVSSNIELSTLRLGSTREYHRYSFSGEIYKTFRNDHTFSLNGAYMFSAKILPIYKYFILGGGNSFAGIDYWQAAGSKFTVIGTSYRYAYRKDIFFHLLYNIAFDYNLSSISTPIVGKPFMGFAVGVEFSSILGPLKLQIAYGDKSIYDPGEKRFSFYLDAGYKF